MEPKDTSNPGQFSPSVTGRKVLILAFLIIMVDGYDTVMVSFLAPLIASEWKLSPGELGKVFALGYVGAIFGAISAGYLADKLGRKPILLCMLILSAVTTGMCAMAAAPSWLIALRFFAGFALGGVLPSLISLTAENASAKNKSAAVSLMYIGYPLGAVLGGSITAVFLHHGWRDIFVGGAAATCVALVLALFIPESKKAQKASTHERQGAPRKVGLWEPFAEKRLLPAICVFIGLFCVLLMTYFLISWTPTIATMAGVPPERAALCGVLLNLGGIAGAIASTRLVRRFGPFLCGAIMIAIGSIFIALMGFVAQWPGNAAIYAVAVIFMAGGFALGGQLHCPAMTVQLFPERVRGAGTGWALAAGRVGSVIGPALGGILLTNKVEIPHLFLIFATPAVVAASLFWLAHKLVKTDVSQ